MTIKANGGDGMSELVEEVGRCWPLGGYAPGNYTSKCVSCGKLHEADKRASQCFVCAVSDAKSKIERQSNTIRELREALTPSADTKSAYSGEFYIAIERRWNEDGEANDESEADPYEHITVPWTTIKEIMKAIASKAIQSSKQEGE